MDLSFTCTRLAPSPTGSLHLGHARTFLITWWMTRFAGARILLRMEDLDTRRAQPDRVQQTYDDLRWLGMDWDAGPPEANAGAGIPSRTGAGDAFGDEYVQSRRMRHYEDALDRLWVAGAIYPCTCSRTEIATAVAQSVGAPQEGDVQVRYPGTCRNRFNGDNPRRETRGDIAGRVERETDIKPCWRFRVPEGTVAFSDDVYGSQSWDVDRDSGDFPVTRFDGTPAYQLAVVVDDAAMGVDCVIRGDDLLSSTPRQILLYRAMGLRVPRFAHIPLVVGPDGKRLAKRHGESRIAQFREAGVSAAKIVGWVAWRSGQIDHPREMNARDLVGKFDLAKLPRERVVLCRDDLEWLT